MHGLVTAVTAFQILSPLVFQVKRAGHHHKLLPRKVAYLLSRLVLMVRSVKDLRAQLYNFLAHAGAIQLRLLFKLRCRVRFKVVLRRVGMVFSARNFDWRSYHWSLQQHLVQWNRAQYFHFLASKHAIDLGRLKRFSLHIAVLHKNQVGFGKLTLSWVSRVQWGWCPRQ